MGAPVRSLLAGVARGVERGLAWLARHEWLAWATVAAAIALPRCWLWLLAPHYFWSADSGGYVEPAVRWLAEGIWLSDARRGPIYSGFIAAILRVGGNLSAVALVQHLLGGACLVGLLVMLRRWYGPRALVPIIAVGFAAGCYDLPMHLEKMIRNETLLCLWSTLAFAGLAAALQRRSIGGAAVAGGAGALLNLTKSVFLPWLPLALLLLGIRWWGDRRRRWVAVASALAAAYVLPAGAARLAEWRWPGSIGGESYAGIQLYGRVAQWTVLDGGLYPEVKARVRPLVEEYRGRKKPDNNWVIKRGIIPEIARGLEPGERGQLDRLCRQLACEAIRHHPREFLAQAGDDLREFLFEIGLESEAAKPKAFGKMARSLAGIAAPHPAYQLPWILGAYRGIGPDRFRDYYRLTAAAWLFTLWPPVLMTTLALPVVAWLAPPRRRLFWAGAAGIWLFNLVLLSTVGKPLHRYVMPLLPVMILCLGSLVAEVWLRLGTLPGKVTGSPGAADRGRPATPAA